MLGQETEQPFYFFQFGLLSVFIASSETIIINVAPRRDIQPIVLGQWPIVLDLEKWWVDGVLSIGGQGIPRVRWPHLQG